MVELIENSLEIDVSYKISYMSRVEELAYIVIYFLFIGSDKSLYIWTTIKDDFGLKYEQ